MLRHTLRDAISFAVAEAWSEAHELCRELLDEDPCNACAFHLLGAISSCQGDLKTAETFLRRAIALQPRNPGWLRDLGVLHVAAANWPGALDVLSRCLALQPADLPATRLQARALWESGQMEAALAAFDGWAEREPGATKPQLGSARCLLYLNRLQEAATRGKSAVSLEPDSIEGHRLLAEIHYRLHQHEQTRIHRLELMRLLPGDSTAIALCAIAHYYLGEIRIAVSLFRDAIAVGLSAELHAAFLAVLLHDAESTPELLLKEHTDWALRHGAVPHLEPARAEPSLKGGRLRIAYFCAEPANSPVFRFIAPILRNHDRQHFDVKLYSMHDSLPGGAEDGVLAETELRNVSGWTERRVAEQMQRDQVDILVDCSGHYGGGSLLIAAMRPAPVQISWPYYPSTTGLPEMDYLFADEWTCEPEQERYYCERIYRLDSGHMVYDPPRAVSPMGALPAQAKGSVTFGLFQRPAKLNSGVWDSVSTILKSVSKSRLLVHHASAELDLDGSMSRLRVIGALESRGIDPSRVSFRGIVAFRRHVRLLSTVDVALDSFPYTGTTTTCDCLWMGVPVVTLAGATHASRVSTGLLMRLGLAHLVARNVEDYIRIAVRTASDLPALASLRKGLRDRMRASTLVDGARLARHVEEAYQWMWEERMWEERIRPQ